MLGVTNRLMGGPMNVRGGGEGWGEYVACTINQSVVVGAWIVG